VNCVLVVNLVLFVGSAVGEWRFGDVTGMMYDLRRNHDVSLQVKYVLVVNLVHLEWLFSYRLSTTRVGVIRLSLAAFVDV